MSLGEGMRWEDRGQGRFRKNLSGELEYESFVPTPLDNVWPLELSSETINLLSACSRKIGELEGMLRFVPNSNMYLAMYVRKEALLSAQIEGTQCTFDDILDPGRIELMGREVAEVIAYVRATERAVELLDELPLCMRLLREVHKVLLEEGRGRERNPGQTRTSQNWIGPAGCTLTNAAFVPPNVEDMAECLSRLEHFMNESGGIDPIIKAALIHYQFETIHPFLDGNGRLGRLLITLSLMNDHALSGAVFYPSYQLKLNRAEYYSQLMAVRFKGAYQEWISFFCKCLLASAEDAIDSLENLVALRQRNLQAVNESMGRSARTGQRLLELIEANPIIDVTLVADRLKVARTTASNLVKAFQNLEILIQRDDNRQRYRTFLYEEYLSILRQGSDPL